jgi:hypothetical protein
MRAAKSPVQGSRRARPNEIELHRWDTLRMAGGLKMRLPSAFSDWWTRSKQAISSNLLSRLHLYAAELNVAGWGLAPWRLGEEVEFEEFANNAAIFGN